MELEKIPKSGHSIVMEKPWEPKDVEFVFSSYVDLEERLLNFLKVVPYTNENKNTWSPDLVSLFLDVCGMLDSISRRIMSDTTSKNQKVLNVRDFEGELWKNLELEKSGVVVYAFYGLFPNCAITPYQGYREVDGWWTIYNALKHDRLDNYHRANLDNAIKSLAALFLLLVRYKEEEFTRAVLRFEWLITSFVPEVVHQQRSNAIKQFWYDSYLFGTHENPQIISKADINKISTPFGSQKFKTFLGRYNPLA